MLIAIIGGTGLDETEAFSSGCSVTVSTRFGDTELIRTSVGSSEVLFLPRHGRGHATPPDQINVKAHIAALKKCEADRVIGVCAVGSLTKELDAGSFAVLTDFIDLTKRGQSTFCDEPGAGVVHTDFTHPYCPAISQVLSEVCVELGVRVEPKAVYVGVDGSRYETPAEIRLYSSWGAHVIGMTNVAEAVLAREAGLCYGAIAVISNLAAGISPTPLNHAEVRQAMQSSSRELSSILGEAIARMPRESNCGCRTNVGLVLEESPEAL